MPENILQYFIKNTGNNQSHFTLSLIWQIAINGKFFIADLKHNWPFS